MNYVLNCNITGYPEPNVIWTFNGDFIPDTDKIENIKKCQHQGIYHLLDNPTKLAICKVDVEKHMGKYECSAKNEVGSISDEMTLTIEGILYIFIK